MIPEIILPWPPKELSPNSTKDRRAATPIRQRYIRDCYLAAKAAGVGALSGPLHLSLTFCPPDRRKRDLDNMLAAVKYGLDGLSQAIGVDDSEWSLSLRKGEPGAFVIAQFMTAEERLDTPWERA